jgi:hypothetical protein
MDVVISKSDNKNKKMKAVINGKKTVHFGASGYEDFTTHNDPKRRDNYIARHKKNENFGISGIDTAGFWAKNILWNKETLTKSVNDLNNRFKNINIKLT